MLSLSSDIGLRVTDDRMTVLLEQVGPHEDPAALSLRALAEMNRWEIRPAPAREALLARLCEAVERAKAQGEAVTNVTLAQGAPPIHTRHAELEWAGAFFEDGFCVDEEADRVDYRRRQAQAGVESGQRLARLSAAREGRPGLDVFGQRLDVARPRRMSVRVGPGVRVETEDGAQVYYATQPGRVRWAMGMLAVDNVLHVRGNVGLESGDIAHPGAVVVQGDVQAGSRITASGDVEILGTAEPADITAGGDLVVHKGLTGAEGRLVRVGGAVRARFILDAHIEARGDVVVGAELLNTELVAGGALRMRWGRVVGGRITARGGIEARQAGSEAHPRTVLCVAHDAALMQARSEKRARVDELTKNIASIHRTIDPMMARQARLNAAQREHLTVLMSNVFEMEMELAERKKELEEVSAVAAALERVSIVVHERIYAETVIQVCGQELVMKDDMAGPMRAHARGGRVELRAVTAGEAE